MPAGIEDNTITEKKNHFKELGKDFFVYGFMSALSQMSGLLLLPILTRFFSVDEYGLIDIIATFTTLLATFLKFALPSGIARYFNEIQGRHEISKLYSTAIVFVVVTGLVIASGLSIFSENLATLFLSESKYGLFIKLGCWIALFSSLFSLPQMILRMERKIVAYNSLNILSTGLVLILTVYFIVICKSGLVGVFAAQLIAAVVSFIIGLLFTQKHLTHRLSISFLKKLLIFSLPLLPAILVTWINSQADRIILLYYSGLGGVAVYGAAVKVSKIFQFFTIVFKQAWQPYSMLLLHSPERNEFFRKILNYYSGLFASLGLIFIAVCPEIFSLLAPVDYHHSYIIVPWLLCAAILHQSASIINLGIVVSEKTISITIAAWTGVTFNIFLSILLIMLFGFAGAAIGSCIAELIFTGMLWHFTTKNSDIRFDNKTVINVLISYTIASILLLTVMRPTQGYDSLFYRAVILFFSIVFIGYKTFDRSIFNFIKHMLGKKMKYI